VSARWTLVPGGARGLLAALAGAALTVVAIGLPTAVIPNPFFVRMTPVRPHDYALLAATAVLVGALVGSYWLPARRVCGLQEGKLLGGGLLTLLAVGCPVCNKVVVLLLGASGALAYFEPLQPLLGVLSLGLLVVALRLRWRAIALPSVDVADARR